MRKNYIVVTGGAGFVGTNLIKKLINYKNYKIISIDNYSSGTTNNHIKNSKVKNKFYILPEKSVGESWKSKINKILSRLKKKGGDFQFITASENIAWLLNIRGKDSKYTPIPSGHMLINQKKKIIFFCDLKKISSSFKKNFKRIKFIDINYTSRVLSEISGKKFIIDKNTCSIYFENIILKDNKILNQNDSIYHLKSIKTRTNRLFKSY